MGIRRVAPADDAKPAGKLYPNDRYSRRHQHHDHSSPPRGDGAIKPLRSETGMPIERLKPGDDPRRAISRLYTEGRSYPRGRPPHE